MFSFHVSPFSVGRAASLPFHKCTITTPGLTGCFVVLGNAKTTKLSPPFCVILAMNEQRVTDETDRVREITGLRLQESYGSI